MYSGTVFIETRRMSTCASWYHNSQLLCLAYACVYEFVSIRRHIWPIIHVCTITLIYVSWLVPSERNTKKNWFCIGIKSNKS